MSQSFAHVPVYFLCIDSYVSLVVCMLRVTLIAQVHNLREDLVNLSTIEYPTHNSLP